MSSKLKSRVKTASFKNHKQTNIHASKKIDIEPFLFSFFSFLVFFPENILRIRWNVECIWLRSVYFENSLSKVAKISRRKMFKKKDCVVAIVVIYGFLLMLFLAEKKTKNFNSPCSWYEPCVRFCCNNKTTCNDKFIRENFNSSLLPESVRNETIEYKILLGRPTCSLKLLPNTSDEPWSFSEVRRFETLLNER